MKAFFDHGRLDRRQVFINDYVRADHDGVKKDEMAKYIPSLLANISVCENIVPIMWS